MPVCAHLNVLVDIDRSHSMVQLFRSTLIWYWPENMYIVQQLLCTPHAPVSRICPNSSVICPSTCAVFSCYFPLYLCAEFNCYLPLYLCGIQLLIALFTVQYGSCAVQVRWENFAVSRGARCGRQALSFGVILCLLFGTASLIFLSETQRRDLEQVRPTYAHYRLFDQHERMLLSHDLHYSRSE